MLSYLQYIDQNHRVGDVAIQFLLLGHVRQIDQSPGYNARAAIEEKLEVKPLANAWVELNAHHVVVKDIPRELAVESQELVVKKLMRLHAITDIISTVQTQKAFVP